MSTNRNELNMKELEKVSGGYWILDPRVKKKDDETEEGKGGGSGGW